MERQLCFQMDWRSPRGDLRFVNGLGRQLVANQVVRINSLPRRAAQRVLESRERLNAPGEAGREFGWILRPAQHFLFRNRLRVGERILDTVIEVAQQ
jgi:hypothetical protein